MKVYLCKICSQQSYLEQKYSKSPYTSRTPLVFNTFYDLFYYQNALQTPTPNAEFTQRLYSVHAARSQRAHGALEDPIALPQRCHIVLTRCGNTKPRRLF